MSKACGGYEMLEFATSAILEKLKEGDEYKKISREILGDENKVNNDNYELACMIFNQTSSEFFQLGFKVCFSLITDIVVNLQSENFKYNRSN